ncbi:MAG: hypothetical protein ACX94A_05865 [Algiphilus sp.]
MSRLEHEAEILKLARFLDVEADTLDMLGDVPAADIRALRAQVTHFFFASDHHFFKRLVAASRLLPISLLATVAGKVLGPMLSARVAGQMDVDRGVGIAQRLPTEFLAELCLSLDPDHTQDLIRAMPTQRIRDVARVLARQAEYVTMARFVDIVTEEAIRGVLEDLQDDAALLHIAFFVENKARLERILALMPEARLVRIIELAAARNDLWPEALSLMEHVGDGWRGRLGDLAASLDSRVLDSMIRSVVAEDLWSVVLPVVGCMQVESQARFAVHPTMQEPEMLRSALQAADREGTWHLMLPVVEQMDDTARAAVARQIDALDGEQLLRVAEVAAEQGQWPSLLAIIAAMAPQQRGQMMALLGVAPERTLKGLPEALEATQQWALVDAVWSDFGDNAQARLRAAVTAAGLEERLDASSPS